MGQRSWDRVVTDTGMTEAELRELITSLDIPKKDKDKMRTRLRRGQHPLPRHLRLAHEERAEVGVKEQSKGIEKVYVRGNSGRLFKDLRFIKIHSDMTPEQEAKARRHNLFLRQQKDVRSAMSQRTLAQVVDWEQKYQAQFSVVVSPLYVTSSSGDIEVLPEYTAEELAEIIRKSEAREPIPTEVRRFVALRDKGQCRYCTKRRGPFHIDHVIAWSRGGSDDPDNLVLACVDCNLSKGAKYWEPTPLEESVQSPTTTRPN